jgi:hypothetical protein
MNGHPVQQLVDKGPLLRFGGRPPQTLDIEVLEKPGDFLVALSDIVGLSHLTCRSTVLLLNGINLQRESRLLLPELFGGDMAVIVQIQQLLALGMELVEDFRRSWPRPTTPVAGLCSGCVQLPADCLLKIHILTE